MPIGPVRNVARWIEFAGVFIVEENFGTQRIDGTFQWVGDHGIIFINAALPLDRKRLTLAHELGHLVLHTNDLDADVEKQANNFAAEFLIPGKNIKTPQQKITIGEKHESTY